MFVHHIFFIPILTVMILGACFVTTKEPIYIALSIGVTFIILGVAHLLKRRSE